MKLSRKEHGNHLVHITDFSAEPYRLGSQRDKAWRVISLMQNLTVEQAHFILELLEPAIQGKVGRPLGWLSDAVERGLVEVKAPEARVPEIVVGA